MDSTGKRVLRAQMEMNGVTMVRMMASTTRSMMCRVVSFILVEDGFDDKQTCDEPSAGADDEGCVDPDEVVCI